MPIKVTCGACFLDLNVADRFAGKKIKCKSCGSPVSIPVPRSKGKSRAEDNDPDSALAGLDLEDAEDSEGGDGLPEPRRSNRKSNQRPSKPRRSATAQTGLSRLLRHPLTIVLGIELLTAIPGFFSETLRGLFFLIWMGPAVLLLILSMILGLVAAVAAAPAAMLTALLFGNFIARRVCPVDPDTFQQDSPAATIIMKALILSGSVLGVGCIVLIIQLLLVAQRAN